MPHVEGPCVRFRELLRRLGILVELLLLFVEHAHPLHEGQGLPLVGDLRVVDLARGEPLVLLAQLGGKFGHFLAVGFGKLAALQIAR